ncbi:MAG: SiaB family protein kinase [Bacteroidales bacterium]
MRQLEDLKRYFAPTPELKVILAFDGAFSQQMIVSLGDLLRNELSQSFPDVLVNRTFGVFVEMAQNVMHYSNRQTDDVVSAGASEGSILLGRTSKNLVVFTSNLINIDEMADIQRRFKEINQMDSAELKNVYLIKCRQQYQKNSTGAGLGLLDIARRSGKPLGIGFLPEGKGRMRFFFRVLVPC